MKTKLALLFALLLLLPGCDWLKKAADVTISTDLSVDIPVVIVGSKSADLNSEIAAAFNGTAVLSLEDNEDLADYLNTIKEISLENLVVTVEGLAVGETVTSVTAEVVGMGVLGTQTNITSTNNSFEPDVNANVYNAAEAKLLDDLQITVAAHGSTTGDQGFVVNLVFSSKVVANPLD